MNRFIFRIQISMKNFKKSYKSLNNMNKKVLKILQIMGAIFILIAIIVAFKMITFFYSGIVSPFASEDINYYDKSCTVDEDCILLEGFGSPLVHCGMECVNKELVEEGKASTSNLGIIKMVEATSCIQSTAYACKCKEHVCMKIDYKDPESAEDCEYITEAYYKNSCYKNAAEKLNDSEICEKINNSDLIFECLSLFETIEDEIGTMSKSECEGEAKRLIKKIDARCDWEITDCETEVDPGYYYDSQIKDCVYYDGDNSCDSPYFSTYKKCMTACFLLKENPQPECDCDEEEIDEIVEWPYTYICCQSLINKDGFCGVSEKDFCESDSDCAIAGCADQVCASKGSTYCHIGEYEYKECADNLNYGLECECIGNRCGWHNDETEESCKDYKIEESDLSIDDFCSDTDGGENTAIKGTVLDKPKGVQKSDKCILTDEESILLIEYICDEEGSIKEIAIECQNECEDGVCI